MCIRDRYLVIAEKPSVSKAIAEVIGASKKEEGYLEGKGCIVSWCFGHLAEYVPPDSYDERFTRWMYEDLPIIPEEWKLAVSKDKKEQFYICLLYTSRWSDGRKSGRWFCKRYQP